MQRSFAPSGRTSGAGPASRRVAATGNATKAATSTAATSTPLLARSLTPTRTGANAAAPPRRRLLAPPPRASFLDGLLQSDKKTTSFRPPGAAAALVDALLEAVEGSDAGAADKTSQEQREEIARLAAALKRYRMRNPAQSELLWGKYRVSYCSNPNAAGGPVLRSGPGRALAQAQAPEQELVRGGPDGKGGKIRNRVEFSALGLLPRSSAAQEGPLTVTGANTYRVVLEKATRDFEVLYLDSRVRVAEFVPSDGRERQLFVFERIAADDEGEEEEEDFAVEEEAEEGGGDEGSSSRSSAAPSSLFGDFGSFFVKPAESLATVVEREERASAGGGGGSGGGARRQKGAGNKAATAAAAKAKKPSPPAPAPAPFSAPDPAALFEGLISKVTGEDKDSELVRSLRRELAAAAAEAREAERLEKAARSAAAPILRSTAREREELEGAREAVEQAASRARRLAEEAEERAEELARAVAKAK